MYFTFRSTDLFLLTRMASFSSVLVDWKCAVTPAAINFTLRMNKGPNLILTNPDFIWLENQIWQEPFGLEMRFSPDDPDKFP